MDANAIPAKEYIGENVTDTIKVDYLRKMIQLCKKNQVKLVFFVSPRYKLESDKVLDRLRAFCKDENVPLYTMLANNYISEDYRMFANSGHLNEKGARAYSEYVVRKIETITFDKTTNNILMFR